MAYGGLGERPLWPELMLAVMLKHGIQGRIRSGVLHLAAGAMALLVVCGSALALPFQVTIQPINVCDNAGLNCGNPAEELFFAETRKIWAQANLDVNFLSFNTFNNSSFLSLTTGGSDLNALRNAANNGKNANNQVINMWFVNDINSGTVFGEAFIGANGIMIANEVFSANRIDTIAHELGHNLGLFHASAGGDSSNLMDDGASRTSPTSIADIAPDGSMLDVLTTSQINTVQTSYFLVTQADALPEPSGIVVLLIGFAATLTLRPTGRSHSVSRRH